MKRSIAWTLTILFPIVVIGTIFAISRDPLDRNFELPTQMQYSPASLSQTTNEVLPNGMTQQPPVPGTIPRGFKPFHYLKTANEAIRAGNELKNPYSPTEENLKRGEFIYSNYCSVCHGPGGKGDGVIVPKYPNPPSFLIDSSKELPDGNMFHVITLGRNNMPPHAPLVSESDRWKSILYIRKLQGK